MIGPYSINQMDDFYQALSQGQVKPTGVMNYLQRLYIAHRCTAGDRVLDICCGRGLQLPVLYRYTPDIAEYVGLDIAPGNLDEARDRVDGLEELHDRDFGINFVEHDVATAWPPLGTFDVVIYTSALEHLPRQAAIDSLRHALNATAPGGRLYLSTPNTAGEPPRKLQHRVHVYEWHADELTPELDELGWDVLDIVGILPPDTPESMMAALTTRYGPGAADWYARMQATVPMEILGPVAAAAVPEIASELLYVCTPKDTRG
jgi:SAM-dependent methyltransferase